MNKLVEFTGTPKVGDTIYWFEHKTNNDLSVTQCKGRYVGAVDGHRVAMLSNTQTVIVPQGSVLLKLKSFKDSVIEQFIDDALHDITMDSIEKAYFMYEIVVKELSSRGVDLEELE